MTQTVLDPSGEKPRRAGDESPKRKDKYAGMTDAEVDAARRERRKSRRERTEDPSASASDEKRKSKRYAEDEDYPIMSFDGRPERPSMKRSESKRKSFLGSFF